MFVARCSLWYRAVNPLEKDIYKLFINFNRNEQIKNERSSFIDYYIDLKNKQQDENF